MALGCTIQVVTTKDLVNFRAIKDHSNIAANEGFNSIHFRLCFNAMFWVSRNSCSILSAQTATKHITINRTGIEVDIRCLVSIESHTTRSIGMTQCGTAIDITVNDSCTNMGRITYIHQYIAIHQRWFTFTATKDNVSACIF